MKATNATIELASTKYVMASHVFAGMLVSGILLPETNSDGEDVLMLVMPVMLNG